MNRLAAARRPVISLNGNSTVLAGRDAVKLAALVGCKIEINIFYRTDSRVNLLSQTLNLIKNEVASENPSDATKRWLHFGMDAALIALLGVSYQAFETSDKDAVSTHLNYRSATDTQQIESFRTTSLGHNEDAKASAQQTNILIFAVAAMHLYSSYDAFTNGPSNGQASNSKKSKFDLVYNSNLKQPELRFSIALD